MDQGFSSHFKKRLNCFSTQTSQVKVMVFILGYISALVLIVA